VKTVRSLRISVRQLGAHRTRTGLALLGIVIGVSSVIAMVAVGHGARQDVVARVQAMGTDLIMVTPAQIRPTGGRMQVRGTVTTLTSLDATALEEELIQILAAAPWASRRVPVRFQGLSTTTTVARSLVCPWLPGLSTQRGRRPRGPGPRSWGPR
jgi:ABC-type lipoprotein release transport system permease subunit